MSERIDAEVHDPVHRTRYGFRRDGENLIVETWMEPGGGLPKHFHPIQEERWAVLEGEVVIHLDGTDRVLRPADGAVSVHPGAKHALANKSGAEVHLRTEVIPALGLEDFLTESATAAQQGLFRKGGIPTSLKGARWAAAFLDRHGAETVMTFPPRFAQRLMVALLARG